MITLKQITERLKSISIDEISSERDGSTNPSERLGQTKSEIQKIDLHKEFQGKGEQVSEEIEEELKQVEDSSNIYILESLSGGPLIQGGFLMVLGLENLSGLINALVDSYFSLIEKAQKYQKAGDNVDQATQTYRNQYLAVAAYISNLAEATKIHIIDPIIKNLTGLNEINNFFVAKFEELLRRKEKSIIKS